MIDPKLLVVKPVGELERIANPLTGDLLYYDGSANLKRSSLEGFRSLISSGIKGEATPTTTPTPWASGQPDLYEKYDVKTAGTYTNFKDSSNSSLVFSSTEIQNNFAQIWVKNGVSQKVLLVKPSSQAQTTFDKTDNVNPSTMKATYDASGQLVNKAFESSSIISQTNGWDTNGVSTFNSASNQTYILANNVFATIAGTVKKININVETGGSITVVVFSLVGGQVSISSQQNVTVSNGLNALDVNIPLSVGQSIGFLRTTSLKIKFTDGTTGRSYISNAQSPPSVTTYVGYLAYNFVLEYTYIDNTYTVDTIKQKLSQSFEERSFSHELNLGYDNYQRYSKIFNNVTLRSKSPSFGKMNFLKLTGGSLNFDSNFVPQQGSSSYIPTKTNVITTWYEYGKVRYFIENFDFESLTFSSKTITYQDFTNKTANALLSAITADYGINFSGKVDYWKINSAATMLTSTTAASSLATDAISINKGSLVNYKVTMFMGFGSQFVFSPNDATGGTFSDFLRITKGTPNSTIRHTTPNGNFDTTTTLIPSTASTGYLWEIEVKGNSVKVFINSGLAYEGTTAQTGNFFSMAFTGVGDFINSFKLEEL